MQVVEAVCAILYASSIKHKTNAIWKGSNLLCSQKCTLHIDPFTQKMTVNANRKIILLRKKNSSNLVIEFVNFDSN